MRKKEKEINKVIMIFSMSFLPYQGRYLRVYNEAKTLVDAGMDVTILAWDRDCKAPVKELVAGIKIERIWSKAGFQRGPLNIFSVLAFYLRLLPRLLKKKADVIHCFNLDTILPGLFAAKIKGAKAVLDLCEPSYYTNWPRKYFILIGLLQYFERFFSQGFDYLLVHNNYQVEKFQQLNIRAIEQIGSYPNRSLIVDKVRKKNKGNKTVVIGRFGSIYKNNGVEEMIIAFKKLRSFTPNVKLLLAGKVFNEFQKEFDQLISSLGDAVEIYGTFLPEELPGLYEKIDISLQLSRRTDWFKNITPTKFFESLANGVLVVTSDIGGLRKIIKEYNCGLTVDETDTDDVYSALKKLVENPRLREEMARNGLRAIKGKYNWDLMEQKLLNVYRILGAVAAKTSDSVQLEASQC
jgi:glycosyltransferase involved in cell wall biosynthesis